MPEGDTIHRTAASLRRGLLHRRLVRVELPRVPLPHPTPGVEVSGVEARGKHLLIHLDDTRILHTHLRMSGSWHIYRVGERWRRSRQAARAILATDQIVAVCFSAPVVDLLDPASLARHPALRALGPDLTDPDADLDEAVTRIDRFAAPDRTIGEVLLDQRVACGVGNVYRGEVLFLHRLDPTTPLDEVTRELRHALLRTSARLLQANLEHGARSTVDPSVPGSLWVYGRAGQPCRRCGTTIERQRLGEQARVVDRCPACQGRRGVLEAHTEGC